MNTKDATANRITLDRLPPNERRLIQFIRQSKDPEKTRKLIKETIDSLLSEQESSEFGGKI